MTTLDLEIASSVSSSGSIPSDLKSSNLSSFTASLAPLFKRLITLDLSLFNAEFLLKVT